MGADWEQIRSGPTYMKIVPNRNMYIPTYSICPKILSRIHMYLYDFFLPQSVFGPNHRQKQVFSFDANKQIKGQLAQLFTICFLFLLDIYYMDICFSNNRLKSLSYCFSPMEL